MTQKYIASILHKVNTKIDNSEAKQISNLYKFFDAIKENLVLAQISNISSNYSTYYNVFEVETLHEYSSTQSSNYKFVLPCIPEIFNPFANLLGLQLLSNTDNKQIVKTIEVSSEILSKISKAAKFVSKDSLRPAMECVLLHFMDDGKCKVVATDAHKLYKSNDLQCSNVGSELKLLINTNGLLQLTKHKATNENISIEILQPICKNNYGQIEEDIIQYCYIDGIKVELLHNFSYPDYNSILPTYEKKMVFERKALMKLVKQVLPAANKGTYEVAFHLNGNITANSQDVDFSFESESSIPYISKDFEDCNISFNGKLLNECLNTFKEDKLSFYTNGNNKKIAHITNGIEDVYLMPLYRND